MRLYALLHVLYAAAVSAVGALLGALVAGWPGALVGGMVFGAFMAGAYPTREAGQLVAGHWTPSNIAQGYWPAVVPVAAFLALVVTAPGARWLAPLVLAGLAVGAGWTFARVLGRLMLPERHYDWLDAVRCRWQGMDLAVGVGPAAAVVLAGGLMLAWRV